MVFNEFVLCHLRAQLPTSWLKKQVSLSLSSSEILSSISVSPQFLPRSYLENDPTYKQWIPYVLVIQGGRLLMYQRRGSEQRLYNQWSIGIGGHVSYQDWSSNDENWIATILSGAKRELHEELNIDILADTLHILGIVNEEETLVGHVHIGLVCLLQLAQSISIGPSEELGLWNWQPMENVSRCFSERPFELWSKLTWELFYTRYYSLFSETSFSFKDRISNSPHHF